QVAEAELAAPATTTQPSLPFEDAASEKVAAPVAPPPQVEDKPEAAPANEATACIEPTLLSAPTTEQTTAPDAILGNAIEDALAPESSRDPQHSATRHPGILLVLVLVVVCALLAASLWWKLKKAQLSTVMVQPEQKMTKPVAVT